MRDRMKAKISLRDETGSTAVEFAVIAALLFVILFAILEFGFIFLQEHFIANAAREGIRIGVRANNFTTGSFPYNSTSAPAAETCSNTTNRSIRMDCEIREYLQTLYDEDSPVIDIDWLPITPELPAGGLQVTVTVNNFYPPILAGLAGLLPGSGSLTLPGTMAYTAVGEYEDRDEWDAEEP